MTTVIIGKKDVDVKSVNNLNGIMNLVNKIETKSRSKLAIEKIMPKEERPMNSSYDEALKPCDKKVANLSDYYFRW